MHRKSVCGCTITQIPNISVVEHHKPPRAAGAVNLSTKLLGERSVLDNFRQSGSLKCLFPRNSANNLEAVLLNTAGGVTGGDAFRFSAKASEATSLSLTTQACERAYKSQPGAFGLVTNHLVVAPDARMNWLPQETILFNRSALDRRLRVEVSAGAEMLLVEPLVFGRSAMGETLTDVRLRDRIEVWCNGQLAFLDTIRFSGNLNERLSKPHCANGAGAMALVVFASSAAEGQLHTIRQMLPDTAGASLVQRDLMVIRILAKDSFLLRRELIPVLRLLNNDNLPRCWML